MRSIADQPFGPPIEATHASSIGFQIYRNEKTLTPAPTAEIINGIPQSWSL
jgi:hypothetical protein